jgi:hypothetical protein
MCLHSTVVMQQNRNMKKALFALCVLVPVLGFSQADPQHPSLNSAPRNTPTQAAAPASADPKDVDSVDHIVAALYDVISGPANQKRNWDRMKSLFSPNAMLGTVYHKPDNTVAEIDVNVNRYIALSDPFMTKNGFFEKETNRKTEKFGHIVNLFSTYESRYHPEDKPFERGINSIQLYNDGARWWIRSIIWENETDKLKLPSEFTHR